MNQLILFVCEFFLQFAGFEEVIDQFSNDVHCLDLSTMQWSLIHTWVYLMVSDFKSLMGYSTASVRRPHIETFIPQL